jgi:hypothetical protein
MIEHYRFGNMTIDGRQYQNDLKIIDGQVISNWWRKEGHWADVEDMADIVAARPEVLVVGTGSPGRMNLSEELRQALSDLKIRVVEEPTDEAVQTFNRLSETEAKVAAAFHLTC